MKTTATYALLTAGAVSSGVHAGLAPEHMQEWLPLGAAFVGAAAAAGLGVDVLGVCTGVVEAVGVVAAVALLAWLGRLAVHTT